MAEVGEVEEVEGELSEAKKKLYERLGEETIKEIVENQYTKFQSDAGKLGALKKEALEKVLGVDMTVYIRSGAEEYGVAAYAAGDEDGFNRGHEDGHQKGTSEATGRYEEVLTNLEKGLKKYIPEKISKEFKTAREALKT